MDFTEVKMGTALPKIIVKNPVIHNTWAQGKFITYLICIRTDHPSFHLHLSAVRRRFSEIRWLLKVLRANHPHIHFPAPPAKRIFGEQFESSFIDARQKAIEEFLNKLMVTDTVLSDAAFHLFIQTDLTIKEIEEYLEGTVPETTVTTAWQNEGHLHSNRYFVNSAAVLSPEPQEIVMSEEDRQYRTQMSLSYEDSGSEISLRSDGYKASLLDLANNNMI